MFSIQTNQLESIGQRLKQFRLLTEKTQEEFAPHLQITVPDLEEMEQDTKDMEANVLITLTIEYGINIYWLLVNEQPIFHCYGPKVEPDTYNLVKVAPSVDQKYQDISILIEALADQEKRSELFKAHEKITVANLMV